MGCETSSPLLLCLKNKRGIGPSSLHSRGRTSKSFETGHSVNECIIFSLGGIAASTGQFTPKSDRFLRICIGGVYFLYIFTNVFCDYLTYLPPPPPSLILRKCWEASESDYWSGYRKQFAISEGYLGQTPSLPVQVLCKPVLQNCLYLVFLFWAITSGEERKRAHH